MSIKVGESASFSKTISESDIYGFAGLTGDFNSVHVNDEKAKDSAFGRRIAHGMLVGGLISTVIGTKMPGEGTIYLEQDLKFQEPVFIGDTCTAVVTVEDILNAEKGIFRLNTVVKNQSDKTVVDGFAVVKYREENH